MSEYTDNRKSVFSRRGGIWTVVGVLLVAGIVILMFIQPRPRPSPRDPPGEAPRHLIVISIDTLRADHLGCYGHAGAKTPVLDKLASEGVLFERHYTCYPLTLPAHLTQLTGVSTLGHRVRDNLYHRLPDQLMTLPEVLSMYGFGCGAFVSAYTMHQGSGIERGFEVYDDEGVAALPAGRMTVPERKAAQTLGRAAEWLKGQAPGGKRLFCFVHLFDPHAPYDPPADLKAEFAGKEHGLYDAEIAYADRCIGEFFDRLRAMRIYDNAVIVVTADHGEGLGQHDELTHGYYCYDTTTRVPLIVRGGAHTTAGGRAPAVTRNYDLAPTLMDLLGVEHSAYTRQFHGRSLADICAKPDHDPGLSAYVESHYGHINTGWAKIRGLRAKGSLTLFSGELAEHFEAAAQADNIAEQRPEQVARAREEITRLLNSLRPAPNSHVRRAGDPGLGTPYPGESISEQSFEPENIADTRDRKSPRSQARVLLKYQQAELEYDGEHFETCEQLLGQLTKDAPDFVPAHKLLAAVHQLRIVTLGTAMDADEGYKRAKAAFESLLAAADVIEQTSSREAALRMRMNAALLALWLGNDQLFNKAYRPHHSAPPPELEWLMFLNRYIDSPTDKRTLEEAEAFLRRALLPDSMRQDAQATLEKMRKGEKLNLAPWER